MLDQDTPDSKEYKGEVEKQKEIENVSSLVEETQSKPDETKQKLPFRQKLKEDFFKFTQDDSWYELYKSITNEKDMAEKDQQRMIRRERRRIKRKAKLRIERIGRIQQSLKIRAAYRKR